MGAGGNSDATAEGDPTGRGDLMKSVSAFSSANFLSCSHTSQSGEVQVDVSPSSSSSFPPPLPSESVDHLLNRPGLSGTAFGVLPLGVRPPCGVVVEEENEEVEGCEGNLGTDDRSNKPGEECAPLFDEREESSMGLVRDGVTGAMAIGVL